MTAEQVNVDNFARAETHRMMAGLQRDAGGVNRFRHNREPASVDEQTVIRMNRDTLYSFAVVDISAGAILTVPDAGERYLSVMMVNKDHYINRVFHDARRHELTVDELGSPLRRGRGPHPRRSARPRRPGRRGRRPGPARPRAPRRTGRS